MWMPDIVLAGSPNRCEPPEMCKGSEGLFDWRGTIGVRRRASTSMYFMWVLVFILTLCSYGCCIIATATYLFVCQVDGNGWSSQFKQLMMTSALTFKSTIYPEWYITSSLLSSLRFASLPKLKYFQSPQVR